ncbi:MAG: hypothetical protein ACJ76I_00480 [Gaiellaceae bacterium]
MESRSRELIGNRLALAGAVLYFMEWIVIVVAPSLPTDKLGHDPAAIAAAYTDHPARTALLAGWLSFVLLGRILFCVGVRNALRDSGRPSALADWAVAVMTVSVTIEVVDYALVASAAWLAQAHGAIGAIVALDAAGTLLFHIVIAPVGIAVVACSAAMLMSGLFRRWLCVLGMIAGPLLVAGGVVGASAQGSSGGFHDLGAALEGPPVGIWWLWTIATALVLFRAAPRRAKSTQPAPSPAIAR